MEIRAGTGAEQIAFPFPGSERTYGTRLRWASPASSASKSEVDRKKMHEEAVTGNPLLVKVSVPTSTVATALYNKRSFFKLVILHVLTFSVDISN